MTTKPDEFAERVAAYRARVGMYDHAKLRDSDVALLLREVAHEAAVRELEWILRPEGLSSVTYPLKHDLRARLAALKSAKTTTGKGG